MNNPKLEKLIQDEAEKAEANAMIEKLEKALEFYAEHRNWELAVADEFCSIKTKLSKDKEAYGEAMDYGLASKLVYYGGKTAREALAKLKDWRGK